MSASTSETSSSHQTGFRIPPRFSLRTLLILMLLAGPTGAWGWNRWQAYQEDRLTATAREVLAKLRAERLANAINAANLTSQLYTGSTVSPGDARVLGDVVIRANEELAKDQTPNSD